MILAIIFGLLSPSDLAENLNLFAGAAGNCDCPVLSFQTRHKGLITFPVSSLGY